MSTIDVIKLLIGIQQLIDRLIQYQIEKSKAMDRAALAQAIEEARRARSDEEKQAAARRISEAFSRPHGPGPVDRGDL